MSSSDARLNAVIAALEKVREHINMVDTEDLVDATNYNRWIAMLENVVEGNWASLQIEDKMYDPHEFLMHIDAAIAFLSADRS